MKPARTVPVMPEPLPFYRAAHRNKETCAEPGPCGDAAEVDVVFPIFEMPKGGVPKDTGRTATFGFCSNHGSIRLGLVDA